MKKIFVFLLACTVAAGAFAEVRWSLNTTAAINAYGIIIPTGQHAQLYVTDPETGDKVLNNAAFGSKYQGYGLIPRKSTLLFLPLSENQINGQYIPISQAWFRPSVIAGGFPGAEWRSNGVHGFSWTEGSGFGVGMSWGGNNIEGSLQFDGGRIMNILLNEPFPRKRDGDTPRYGDPGLTSLSNLLNNFFISEYWIRANMRLFYIHFGNRGGGGLTDDMQVHTDWIPTPVRIDGFGVNIPSPEGPMSPMEGHRNLHNVGAKDSLFSFHNGGWMTYDLSSYIVGRIKLPELIPTLPFPLFVDLSMDFDPGIFKDLTGGQWDFSYGDYVGDADYYYQYIDSARLGETRVGGGIRISGDMAFDVVTFDLAYKLRGGSYSNDNTFDLDENPSGTLQPDGEGFMTQVAGAYFTIPRLVPDLGIGLGYTALFRTFEDLQDKFGDEPLMKTTSPLFSGIDLFLRYSGIPFLSVTFKNNVSFANVPGAVVDDDGNTLVRRYGIDGNFYTDQYYSQDWFALYNSLAVRYLLSGAVTLNMEVISHLGIITEKNTDEDRASGLAGWGKRVRTKHTISGAIYAVHTFSSNINLQIGVSVYSEHAFTDLSDFSDRDPGLPNSFDAGGLGISVPIKVKLNW